MPEKWIKAAPLLLAAALGSAILFGRDGIFTKAAEIKKTYQSTEDTGNTGPAGENPANEGPTGETAADTGRTGEGPAGRNTANTGKGYCIVIDPGHGGFDPGKIGVNSALEKDVNLAIASKLKTHLEAAGVRVVMTRDRDEALGEGDGEHKKVQDLKERIRLIDQESPAAAISIHQNSFPQEEIRGAQVFYYVSSREGKRLAELLQKRMIDEVDPENDRTAKDNNSYFLLKKTKTPLVIVECGFLSNYSEAQLLVTEDYQNRIAYAVSLGILDYLETLGEENGAIVR